VKHNATDSSTHLYWMTDVIYLPATDEVISFGDLILAIGLVNLAFHASRRRRRGVFIDALGRHDVTSTIVTRREAAIDLVDTTTTTNGRASIEAVEIHVDHMRGSTQRDPVAHQHERRLAQRATTILEPVSAANTVEAGGAGGDAGAPSGAEPVPGLTARR